MGNMFSSIISCGAKQRSRPDASPRSTGTVEVHAGARARLSSEQWLRKCSAAQSANVSSERIAQARVKADRASRLSRMSKKASKLQKCNMMQQRAWNTEMKIQASEEIKSLAAPARAEMYQQSSMRASSRMELVQRVAAEESSDEEELESMGIEMGIAPLALAAVDAMEQEGQLEMQELLEQLKVEPAEAVEQQAKFCLFEKYLETVEKMRNETFEFWAEAKEEFHASGKSDVERALKKIDGQDNMGIDFVPGRWFVYDMTQKAGTNCALIGRNLAMIKSRLELLAQQDDCPICLEELGTCGEEPHVLGCCHKVCGECWSHWSAMHGGTAFCPLCRNEEFLGDIMRRASSIE